MNIRVNPTSSAPVNSVTSTSAIASVKMNPSVSTPGAGRLPSDTANFSQISGLVAKAIDQPEVRTDKVEAIKAQIAAGTYDVNPLKIANAMINSALNRDI
jgi:flagellar biosynthesis anti-sigma factor FlgM